MGDRWQHSSFRRASETKKISFSLSAGRKLALSTEKPAPAKTEKSWFATEDTDQQEDNKQENAAAHPSSKETSKDTIYERVSETKTINVEDGSIESTIDKLRGADRTKETRRDSRTPEIQSQSVEDSRKSEEPEAKLESEISRKQSSSSAGRDRRGSPGRTKKRDSDKLERKNSRRSRTPEHGAHRGYRDDRRHDDRDNRGRRKSRSPNYRYKSERERDRKDRDDESPSSDRHKRPRREAEPPKRQYSSRKSPSPVYERNVRDRRPGQSTRTERFPSPKLADELSHKQPERKLRNRSRSRSPEYRKQRPSTPSISKDILEKKNEEKARKEPSPSPERQPVRFAFKNGKAFKPLSISVPGKDEKTVRNPTVAFKSDTEDTEAEKSTGKLSVKKDGSVHPVESQIKETVPTRQSQPALDAEYMSFLSEISMPLTPRPESPNLSLISEPSTENEPLTQPIAENVLPPSPQKLKFSFASKPKASRFSAIAQSTLDEEEQKSPGNQLFKPATPASLDIGKSEEKLGFARKLSDSNLPSVSRGPLEVSGDSAPFGKFHAIQSFAQSEEGATDVIPASAPQSTDELGTLQKAQSKDELITTKHRSSSPDSERVTEMQLVKENSKRRSSSPDSVDLPRQRANKRRSRSRQRYSDRRRSRTRSRDRSHDRSREEPRSNSSRRGDRLLQRDKENERRDDRRRRRSTSRERDAKRRRRDSRSRSRNRKSRTRTRSRTRSRSRSEPRFRKKTESPSKQKSSKSPLKEPANDVRHRTSSPSTSPIESPVSKRSSPTKSPVKKEDSYFERNPLPKKRTSPVKEPSLAKQDETESGVSQTDTDSGATRLPQITPLDDAETLPPMPPVAETVTGAFPVPFTFDNVGPVFCWPYYMPDGTILVVPYLGLQRRPTAENINRFILQPRKVKENSIETQCPPGMVPLESFNIPTYDPTRSFPPPPPMTTAPMDQPTKPKVQRWMRILARERRVLEEKNAQLIAASVEGKENQADDNDPSTIMQENE